MVRGTTDALHALSEVDLSEFRATLAALGSIEEKILLGGHVCDSSATLLNSNPRLLDFLRNNPEILLENVRYPSRRRGRELYKSHDHSAWIRRAVCPRFVLLDDFLHRLSPSASDADPEVMKQLADKFKPKVIWGPDPPVIAYEIRKPEDVGLDSNNLDLHIHPIWDGEYGKTLIDDERIIVKVRGGYASAVVANYGHFQSGDEAVYGDNYVVFFYRYPGHNPATYLSTDQSLGQVQARYGPPEENYTWVNFNIDDEFFVIPGLLKRINFISTVGGWKYPESWFLLLKQLMISESKKKNLPLPMGYSRKDFATFTKRPRDGYQVGDAVLPVDSIRFLDT